MLRQKLLIFNSAKAEMLKKRQKMLQKFCATDFN